MKKLLLLIIICCVSITYAQKKKPVVSAPAVQVKKPISKITLENIRGEKFTGLLVSADIENITIEISNTNVKFSITDLRQILVGDYQPAPPVPVVNYAENALKALRKISSAVEVGVSYQNYSALIISVKADVDDNLQHIKDENVKNEILSAMAEYSLVLTLWNESIQRRSGDFLAAFEPYKSIQAKYKVKTYETGGNPNILLMTVSETLNAIWISAKTHIESASKSLK
jgi:hypothetical protein